MLLQLDLRTSWNWHKNISWASVRPQPNPRTRAVPRYAMAGGTMFHGPYNDSRVWTYSGTTFRGNDTMLEANYPEIITKVTDQYPLWSFDNGSQIWEQYDTMQSITPSYGAATEASDQGLGFFLHGKVDNGTNAQRWNDGDLTTLVSGMMVVDTVHQSARSISTSTLKHWKRRYSSRNRRQGLRWETNLDICWHWSSIEFWLCGCIRHCFLSAKRWWYLVFTENFWRYTSSSHRLVLHYRIGTRQLDTQHIYI